MLRHGRLVGKFLVWNFFFVVFFWGSRQALGSIDLYISLFLFFFGL